MVPYWVSYLSNMSRGGCGTSRPWNSSRGYSSSRGSGGGSRGGSRERGHQSSGRYVHKKFLQPIVCCVVDVVFSFKY